MKIISLFSGIGAFEKALTNLNIDYELVGFSEIDKYAIKSYCAIHNVSEDKNLGDITKIEVDKLPQDIDLITHGSPCQDFSIAGKQQGAEVGSGTRSSLMWNTVEIVKHCRPKYIIWENVKNLLSAKHRHNFDNYIKIMEEFGYNNYYQVLNAKDYGIPQNRERVYTVSIRQDINKDFIFPEKEKLELRLKNLLEDEVEEKYYLNKELFEKLKSYNYKSLTKLNNTQGCCNTITAIAGGHREPKVLINVNPSGKGMNGRVFDSEYLSPTLTTNKGEGIKIYSDYSLQKIKNNIKSVEGTSNTITANPQSATIDSATLIERDYRIRKLTPKECWRLMGFSDEDFEKAKATGNSNSQLYKQAGNSIVVNVLEEIFRNLLEDK